MKTLYETIFDKEASLENVVVKPRSNSELKRIITEHIKKLKPKPGDEVDLNWIDISQIDDLSGVFSFTNYIPVIDKWDITHVKDFKYMFACSVSITRSPIPVLQKKLLAKQCYERMFVNCIALKEPPELPAMKLKEGCYRGMFCGCNSLKVAPELPAMKLALGCYTSMFKDCTSLVNPPDLPAIELTKNCYDGMFQGCSKLETKAKVSDGVVLNSLVALVMYLDCPNIK